MCAAAGRLVPVRKGSSMAPITTGSGGRTVDCGSSTCESPILPRHELPVMSTATRGACFVSFETSAGVSGAGSPTYWQRLSMVELLAGGNSGDLPEADSLARELA